MSKAIKKEISFETHIGILTYLNGMHYMFIPSQVVAYFESGFNKRLVATVNQKIQWKCGFMSLSEGNGYISISTKRLKEAHLEAGDSLVLHLIEDDSKYGTDVPEELEAVFASDPEGYGRFENLKPALQRYMINHVAGVKNPDKRIERALLLLGNLKLLKPGEEDFRQLLGLPPREI